MSDKHSERTRRVRLTVNGAAIERETSTRRLLSDFLRHELGLHGTHVGCEHGVCGCCTVLIDGRSARSCLAFAVACDGAEITTVEGLVAPDGELHPVQQAFVDCHGLQCGFCTPGFIIAVVAYLDENPGRVPSEKEIREAIAGNLCRCTGYQPIVEAVRTAAERLSGQSS
jgi:aerobic-type carbon monoxide dehydrogenase small subunit (CoxS/CutS family)